MVCCWCLPCGNPMYIYLYPYALENNDRYVRVLPHERPVYGCARVTPAHFSRVTDLKSVISLPKPRVSIPKESYCALSVACLSDVDFIPRMQQTQVPSDTGAFSSVTPFPLLWISRGEMRIMIERSQRPLSMRTVKSWKTWKGRSIFFDWAHSVRYLGDASVTYLKNIWAKRDV